MTDQLSLRLVPDELWDLVQPHLPKFRPRPQGGGTAPLPDRQVLTAITYVLTSGCAWRDLPPSSGVPFQTAHRRFAQWTKAGLWPRLHRAVLDERSLPLDTARESGAMLAYAMNGRPLPLQHGYPVRLVVPGWYGVASVKWLTAIELTDRPFDGYFQAVKYWYEFPDDPAREPVTLQRVRALITGPGTGEQLSAGSLLLRGVAWSGLAPIARVDVSV